MKKIVIPTTTRSEYGLLKPIILGLQRKKDIDVHVVVSGAHLSPEFGMTIEEIENDGIIIEKRIEILLSSDTHISVSKAMGLAMISFSEYFDELKPDALIVLGDRYETLAICCAATNARIPIFHIHGGETTEGLIDEAIRHSITKMSYLHFTSTEAYRRRVIQMGENPLRVFNTGAIGVENALKTELLDIPELEESIGHKLGDSYAIGTFHPVTLENSTAEDQVQELLTTIDNHKEIVWLFTKANSDTNGRIINKLIAHHSKYNKNIIFLDSLGTKNYLSAVKHALFVIGNSSSGLIEVPSFGIPTINIGDRQRGRIYGQTVINADPVSREIEKAILKALSPEFRAICKTVPNPYGDGTTSSKIINIVNECLNNGRIDIKKPFYDIEFEVKDE